MGGDVGRIGVGLATFGLSEVPGLVGKAGDFLKGPEVPRPPTPEAPVETGSEGVRRGEMARQSKRRALGSIHLTRGQSRATDATLGGIGQKLG